MARILIAGCGDVGTLLAQRLLRERHTVWGLRRRPTGFPDGLIPISADLCDPAALAQLPLDLDYVVYAAAADAYDPARYRSAYVEGFANLVAALRTQLPGLKRFLFTSSTGVYGQQTGEWVDESSATHPQGFSGEVLLEAEARVRDLPCPHVTVRFGGIYGPGRDGLLERVRAGRTSYVEGESRYTNRIHREDCAGVLAHLLFVPEVSELYLGVDSQPICERELLTWLAQELEAPPPKALPADQASERRGGNKRCSNRRLLDCGYVFRYPSYREGFAEQLRAIKGI